MDVSFCLAATIVQVLQAYMDGEWHRTGRIRPKHPCGFAGPTTLVTALKILNKLYCHLHRNLKSSKFSFSVGISSIRIRLTSRISMYAHIFLYLI